MIFPSLTVYLGPSLISWLLINSTTTIIIVMWTACIYIELINWILFILSTTLETRYMIIHHHLITKSCPTPWTVAYQAPLSMGLPRQEYRSGPSLPSPGDLPNSGIESVFPAWQVDSLTTELPGKPSVITDLTLVLVTKYFWLPHSRTRGLLFV